MNQDLLLFTRACDYEWKIKAMKFFQRKKTEINSSSMADIAFLLLIFFLVTTTIQTNQGLSVTLPPHSDKPPETLIHDRNLYKVQINSRNNVMVEDQPFESLEKLHAEVKEFILNYGKDPGLSDNPEKAVISLKMNRGTHYKKFIEMMDALQGVYYEIYGERVGLTAEQFRSLDLRLADQKAKYDRARDGIPMRISIAEPNKVN
ncbi:MAG: biopolymer transporter ExbD [Cytophagales bacterium]|nr:biopolymer transporter ExbD [Cytophagales bacterium]